MTRDADSYVREIEDAIGIALERDCIAYRSLKAVVLRMRSDGDWNPTTINLPRDVTNGILQIGYGGQHDTLSCWLSERDRSEWLRHEVESAGRMQEVGRIVGTETRSDGMVTVVTAQFGRLKVKISSWTRKSQFYRP